MFKNEYFITFSWFLYQPINNTKLILFDTDTSHLTEYHIDLNLKQSELHYYNGKLYVIGGYVEDTYSKTPSKGVYEIDLNELSNTEIQNFKKMN